MSKNPKLGRRTVRDDSSSHRKTNAAAADSKDDHGLRVPRQHRLAFLIYDVARAMRNINDEAVRPFALTQAQWSLLVYLVELDGVGMMQAELGKLLNIGKVSIGGLCDRLERAGFIKRAGDKADRRVNRVFITKEGLKVVGEVDAVGMKRGDEIAEGISKEHLQITMSVLLRIKEKMLVLLAE